MGGIKPDHIPGLLQRGVRVIALVSAVTAAPDPTAAARDLLRIIGIGFH
jgi:thiamine monophosphate synthase